MTDGPALDHHARHSAALQLRADDELRASLPPKEAMVGWPCQSALVAFARGELGLEGLVVAVDRAGDLIERELVRNVARLAFELEQALAAVRWLAGFPSHPVWAQRPLEEEDLSAIERCRDLARRRR